MVTKNQIKAGLVKFIDNELINNYPESSMQRVLIGAAIAIIVKNNEKAIDSLTENPFVKMLNVTDENGNIDIEQLRDAIKENMSSNGIVYEDKFLGKIVLDTGDIDKLYSYIINS